MDESIKKRIIEDHIQGFSYRNLGNKYGIGATTAYDIVMKKKETGIASQGKLSTEELPEDISALKAALREERLRNELLNTMIDIASKELGVDIRKKSGTR